LSPLLRHCWSRRCDCMWHDWTLSLSIFTARCTLVQARSCDRMSSVCPSVTVDYDHIGWNSSELISPLVSLRCSLSADPNSGLLQGNTRKFWHKVTHPLVDLSVGDIRSQIVAEWLQRAQRSQWRAYRKPPSLFGMVPSLTPTTSHLPKNGGFHMLQNTRMATSATGDRIHFMFCSRVGPCIHKGSFNSVI